MSKDQLLEHVGDVKFQPAKRVTKFSHIYWDQTLNPRRDLGSVTVGKTFKDTPDVVKFLAANLGWDHSYQVKVEGDLTQEEIDRGVLLRKAELEALQRAAASPEAGELAIWKLQIYRHYWCSGKDEPDAPIVRGIDCNRRGNALPSYLLYMAAPGLTDPERQTWQVEGHDDSISAVWPIKGQTVGGETFPGNRVPDPDLRRAIALRENLSKTAGFKKMTDAETIMALHDVIINGGLADGALERFGIVGTQRVCYAGIIRLVQYARSRRFGPLFELYERFMQPEQVEGRANPKFFPISCLLGGNGQKIWQGSSEGEYKGKPLGLLVGPDSKFEAEAEKRKAAKDGDPSKFKSYEAYETYSRKAPRDESGTVVQLERPDKEALEDHLEYARTGRAQSGTKKLAPKNMIENWSDSSQGHQVKALRHMAKAILDGGKEHHLAPIVEKATAFNALYDLTVEIATGVGVVLEKMLAAELTVEQQSACVKAFAEKVNAFVREDIEKDSESPATA